MGRRGPKSPAEIMAPVPTELPQRPAPPDELDDAGRARWRELVNELPVGRFRVSDLRMLADLIRSEQYVAECDENIRINGQVVGPGVTINPAVVLREKHLRIIVALQRALRLCPSMRVRQDSAKLNDTGPKKKPWEK